MADYNNDGFGGDGEKLIEQRNESSVLFSLDSLSSMSEASEEDEGAFGGSGDKSGLIDLNTLAAMSESGGGDEEYSSASPVFNSVASKSDVAKKWIFIGLGILVAIGLCVGGYFAYDYFMQQKAELEKKLADSEQSSADEKAELEKKLKAAETAQQTAEANAKRREADQEALKAELAKQDEKRANEEAAAAAAAAGNAKKTGSANKPSGASGAAAPAEAAPAAPKGKGPSKQEVQSALQASNTKAQKCGNGGTLKVTMTLNGNGTASNVKSAGGSFAGNSAVEGCILTVVKKHNFPQFSGSPVNVSWNYKL